MTSTDTGTARGALGSRLGYRISQTRNAVLAAIDAELDTLGVTSAQYIVLMGIAHEKDATPGALARLLGCDSGAMTRLLDRIAAKGLIRRVRSIDDRRAVRVELTEAGSALQPALAQAGQMVHTRLARGFAEADLELFHAFLERVAVNAGPLRRHA